MAQTSREVRTAKQNRVLQGSHHLLRRCLWLYAAILPLAILPLLGAYSPALPVKLVVVIALFNHTLAGGRDHLPIMVRAATGWVVIAFLSTFWSSAPGITLQLSVSLTLNVFVVLAICRLTSDEVVGLLPPLVFSTALLALFILSSPAQVNRGGRAGIGGVDENVTAFVLTIAFAVAIGLLLRRGTKRKAVYAVATLPITAAIFHLGSRSGVLALAITVVVVYVAALRVRPEKLLGRVIVLAGALGAGLYFVQQLLAVGLAPQRIVTMLETRSVVDDSDRGEIVRQFLELQGQWIWFGIGYGADADFLRANTGVYKSLHSQFWSSWVELGIPGLVVLGVVAVCWIMRFLRAGSPVVITALTAPVALFAATLSVDKVDASWFLLGVTAMLTQRHHGSLKRGEQAWHDQS